MFKKVSILLLLFLFAFAKAQTDIPPFSALIVDESKTLTPNQLEQINQLLLQVNNNEKYRGAQIAVLMIPRLNHQSIEEYAVKVFETWKIGTKENDNGVLLVISKNDRQLRIEVGYGLEGTITDATAGAIIRNSIAPYFKDNNYYQGILSGINQLLRLISSEAPNFKPYQYSSADDSLIPKELETIYPIYALISLLICYLIMKKVKFIKKENIGGRNFATGALNGFSGGAFLFFYQLPLSSLIPLFFFTFVVSVIILGAFTQPKGGGGGGFGGGFSGTRIGGRSRRGGFGGGGFGGGRGGRSGGGGASGGW